jgi:hypothetical protein
VVSLREDVEAEHPDFDIRARNTEGATEGPMKYLLLIYHNPGTRQIWEALSDDQRAEGLGAYRALNEELAGTGELIVTEALADPPLAKRVTVRDGQTVTSDGPFAEAKEQLAGFYLVDCEDMDRAVAIAARIPEAPVAQIEVRPIMTYSALEM